MAPNTSPPPGTHAFVQFLRMLNRIDLCYEQDIVEVQSVTSEARS